MIDFSVQENEMALQAAFKEVRARRAETYPARIGLNKSFYIENARMRENPSDKREILGMISQSSQWIADSAVATAASRQRIWAQQDLSLRVEVLKRTAEILRAKRFFLAALLVLEVGKTRKEAAGEIAEAIDFLEYYAACVPFLTDLQQRLLVQTSGEVNSERYEALGVGVSLQPWNFPLAISVGPAAAALVMGNAVVYKPASCSSIIGYVLADAFQTALHDCGACSEVFQYLPGSGEDLGCYLIKHIGVDFVMFTGSDAVGTNIEHQIAVHNNMPAPPFLSGKTGFRKHIAAMEKGGKGAIIVDESANLEEAAWGIYESALGFQGQKCSACTRIIALHSVYDRLLEILASLFQNVSVGPPEDNKNFVGPLISHNAYKRFVMYSKVAKKEGRIVSERAIPTELLRQGYFVKPLLVESVDPGARVAQEEIFGPLLVAFRASTFSDAVDLANCSSYGLTGGVYSKDLDHIALAVRDLKVGNLYINRKITGAVVGRQPFGGIGRSGDGLSKAGGWEYLLHFVTRKNICERVP